MLQKITYTNLILLFVGIIDTIAVAQIIPEKEKQKEWGMNINKALEVLDSYASKRYN